jgi:hypothetical protein
MRRDATVLAGRKVKVVAVALLLAAAAVLASLPRTRQDPARPATVSPTPSVAAPVQPPLPEGARRFETLHYVIHSSATAAQTRRVAAAVEHVRRAYGDVFEPSRSRAPPLELVLYRDRAEFKAHNRSRPWAEAYYLPPRCHAYYADGTANPHHWMVHEATHQLMRQVSGFPRVRWSDEGIASYFGASLLDGSGLHPGRIDTGAYPVWWLGSHVLEGRLQADIAAGRVIALQDLLDGTGPDFDSTFNQHYLQYWSLVHFLLHGADGRHAAGFRRVVAEGGSAEAFRRHVGPVERIEAEWYAYFLELVRQARASRLHGSRGPAGR